MHFLSRSTLCFYLLLLLLPVTWAAPNKTKIPYVIEGIGEPALTYLKKNLRQQEEFKSIEDLKLHLDKALQSFGYFNAQINISASRQKIKINIQPGPQVYIRSLLIKISGQGQDSILLKKALSELTIKEGAPLLIKEYQDSKQKLLDTAENLGYLHASYPKAQVLIDEQSHTADIELIMDTGPLFYFGQVQFNPTTINPDLLHRFVPYKVGQPYATEEILSLNSRLSDSGYFSSVIVKPQIGQTKTVPVNVLLKPVPKYTYTLGAGYGTDTGIRGRAGLYVTPVNRRGHKFNTIAQGSFYQNALQAQYTVPGQNPIQDQYNLTGNFSNLNYTSGYSDAYRLSLAQQHTKDYFKRNISLNALYESFNYTFQPNNYEFMLYPRATFTFNKVESPLFSPSGYNLTFNGLATSQSLLSKTSMAQGSIDAKGALMINPLRLRLYGHLLQGGTAIKQIDKLPLSLALLLGGMDNLKAYSFNSIGPGKVVSYAGFELQKEVIDKWYLIGFYDAGAVYNPTPYVAQYDAGFALMWVSPIGPVKVGLAQPINSRLQRVSTNPRLVISMGPDL